LKASEIAQLVNGEYEGGTDPDLTGVAPLDRAGPCDLSFLANGRYLSYLDRARAGAVLMTGELSEKAGTALPRIIVRDVHRALAALLPRLYPRATTPAGIHPTAILSDGVKLGDDVRIDAYAVLESGARVGDRARIGAHVSVGAGCEVGEDAVLHAHVTLYPGVTVGARSVLHSGVRAGVDGFGYVFADGRHNKIPQVGTCVIGADVEIGANCTIDRGSVGATEIGDGVKIDNLVHIGHNVRVGENSIIVAQVGIAGSAVIGRGVTLAGQAGVQGHMHIGDGATIGGQAGVLGDVPAGGVYSGYPARPHRESLRAQASLFRLPELLKRLRDLERAVTQRGK
jgi:UDP-3-O-[3-hydroxymyristoyl] glucosamine N-acyltransferase